MNKKQAPIRLKNDVTRTSVKIARTNGHRAELKWLWRHMDVTKILMTKKQETANNNSPSYRCAAIKNLKLYLNTKLLQAFD